MKNFSTILLFFLACFFVTKMNVANDLSEEKEVKIFQISFEQDVNRNFDDLLLRKTEGFIMYQWEPEGLYVVMEKGTMESEMNQALSQLNFTGFYKISKIQNRVLPVSSLTK